MIFTVPPKTIELAQILDVIQDELPTYTLQQVRPYIIPLHFLPNMPVIIEELLVPMFHNTRGARAWPWWDYEVMKGLKSKSRA